MNPWKKFLRILTVVFAVTVLAAYVVHSQLQHNRTVAPGSKTMVVTPAEPKTNRLTLRTEAQTNRSLPRVPDIAIWGTKAPARVLTLPAEPVVATPALSPHAVHDRVASGSKSGIIFRPEDTTRLVDGLSKHKLELPRQ